MPIWIGRISRDRCDEPGESRALPASDPRFAGSAFFKVEVSSRDNRIYVTEGLYGLAVFIQDPETRLLGPEPETRFPIGVGDERCDFDEGGVSDICWAWAIDEVGELVAVTYGVLGPPHAGGYQLISMPTDSVEGEELMALQATPVPEPHLLLLQGFGVLAVAGLGRLRRKRRERSPQG